MRVLAPARSSLYELQHRLWSVWARRRYAADFAAVERFCLFVGYPRSGHSLVGALLNAHRHAVISHELDIPPIVLAGGTRDALYGRILARAGWFDLRGNRSNYDYQVPNQWQGRFAALRVIGDKRGGAVTRCLAAHPDFFERLRDLVGVPLRLIHVVRNPFDNIAAISLWHDLPLDRAIDFYFAHVQTTARLDAFCHPGEWTTVHHEDVVRAPAAALSRLCDFVGLEADESYLADCAGIVFGAPTRTRRKVDWSPEQARAVEQSMRPIPFLRGYRFEGDDAPFSP